MKSLQKARGWKSNGRIRDFIGGLYAVGGEWNVHIPVGQIIFQ